MNLCARRPTAASDGGDARAAVLLCAGFLALYLVTVHAQHFAPTAEATMAHGVAMTHSLQPVRGALPLMFSGHHLGGMDCPLPSLLASRLDPLPDLAPLAFWLVLALSLSALVLLSLPLKSPPHLPSLARQTLLCRFQL